MTLMHLCLDLERDLDPNGSKRSEIRANYRTHFRFEPYYAFFGLPFMSIFLPQI